jgi:hypothetical protein
MALSRSLLTDARRKITTESWRAFKRIYQATTAPTRPQTILFVIGCQRSGTTLMMRIFEKDLNTSIYHEHSRLSSQDRLDRLRLNPLPLVQRVLSRDNAPFIILKPLVESQNARTLLEHFANARALWMYRHYVDVAASNLKRFGMGNGIRNLRFIVQGDAQNWRSEKVSDAVREQILHHFSEEMNPYDAAALFWYARNSLFFEQELATNPHVMLCRYADLVLHPQQTVEAIYTFAGQPFPDAKLLAEIKSSSLGKGSNIELSPAVDQLCAQLLERLDRVYTTKPYYHQIHAGQAHSAAQHEIAAPDSQMMV